MNKFLLVLSTLIVFQTNLAYTQSKSKVSLDTRPLFYKVAINHGGSIDSANPTKVSSLKHSIIVSIISVGKKDALGGKLTIEKLNSDKSKGLGEVLLTSRTSRQKSYDLILNQGLNEFEIKYELDGMLLFNEMIYIQRNYKPSLYVFSLGISYTNSRYIDELKYTGADAELIVEKFKTQSGKAYENVYSKVLTTPEKTTATAIGLQLQDFVDEHTIDPEDVFILFVSSHGIMPNERWLIPGSDFDSRSVATTSIDFENGLLSKVRDVNCKKVLLIDACYSGTIANAKDGGIDARNSIVEQIKNLGEGYIKIMSSSRDEKSYELRSKKYGAFTYALKKAFEGDVQDENNNGYIDFLELRSQMPSVLKKLLKEEPNLGKPRQTPIFDIDSNFEDFPLFENVK